MADEKQDRRYPIPKGIWPGFVGFEQKFDPINVENEMYTFTINRKSIVQMTRLSLFVQEQLRQLISIYPLTHQLSQNFQCLKMRSTMVLTFKQLRYHCSPFIAELMR